MSVRPTDLNFRGLVLTHSRSNLCFIVPSATEVVYSVVKSQAESVHGFRDNLILLGDSVSETDVISRALF